MSEPASLIVSCRIAPDRLAQVLAARGPRVTDWSDWHLLGAGITASELAGLDLQVAASTGEILRRLRASAERPADWLFAHDADRQSLTIGQTLFSDSWMTIIPVLAALRRLGAVLRPDDRGVVLVHDWIFGRRGTLAALELSGAGSAIAPAGTAAPDAQALAASVLPPIRQAVRQGLTAPLRDDLDGLIGSR